MIRLIFAVTSAIFLTGQAMAHDFWLDARDYQMEKPGFADIGVLVGHPGEQHHWPMSPHRLVSFRSISPAGIVDHQSRAGFAKSDQRYLIPLKTPGLHVVSIETTSAVSVLDAEKFASYLEEEGLKTVAIHRKVTGMEDEKGREIYSRRGKALIKVGNETAPASALVQSPIGLTLELTPLQNPYALEPGEPLQVEVRYRGQKTAGVSVGLFRLNGKKGRVASHQSNPEGIITIERPENGAWMLHAVWSDALEGDSRAEYDTIFSSLSFGFDK